MWFWDIIPIERNKGNLEGINLGEGVKDEHRTFVILHDKWLSMTAWSYQKLQKTTMKKQANTEQKNGTTSASIQITMAKSQNA